MHVLVYRFYREYNNRKKITSTQNSSIFTSFKRNGHIIREIWRERCSVGQEFDREETCRPGAYSDGLDSTSGPDRGRVPLNRKSITFFFSDLSEYLSLQPVVREADARGYATEFSMDFRKQVEIGVYCNHRPDASNSRFSVVMLHQIGQDQWPECPSKEPNAWVFAPWDAFDIGILPGRASSQAWYSVSQYPYSRPRLGVFELGNPKSDKIFRDSTAFHEEVAKLGKTLGLKDSPTVLYAPSHTSEEKQEDFVRSLVDMPLNLLIKHYPWRDPDNQDRISNISEKLQGLHDKGVYIVEPEVDIMTCLALSDVVVSDESNCLVEALLFEVPGISVMDWLSPSITYFGKVLPERAPDPPPCAIRTTRAELGAAVKDAILNRDRFRPRLRQYRAYYYSHLGKSSELTMDVIEAALSGALWPIEPLLPKLSALFDDVDMDRDRKDIEGN